MLGDSSDRMHESLFSVLNNEKAAALFQLEIPGQEVGVNEELGCLPSAGRGVSAVMRKSTSAQTLTAPLPLLPLQSLPGLS